MEKSTLATEVVAAIGVWDDAKSIVAGNESVQPTTKGSSIDDVETPDERNKDDGAESSGSEAETEPARSFHRKLSTNRAIKNAVSFFLLFMSVNVTENVHQCIFCEEKVPLSDTDVGWLMGVLQ